MIRQIVIVLFLFSSLFKLMAQGPPITVGTPVMLGLEGGGIRTFGKFISKENANIYVQPFVIPYNITSKFQVGTILPFVFKTPKGSSTVGGFGDMAIFAKYQLYKKDGKAKTFRILGTIKQTFPTGKTSSFPPIGSDLYQTQIGLVMGRISSAIGIYSDFGYNITNKGASDNFTYNFSVGIPLLAHQYPQKQINTYLEFNGNYVFDLSVHTLFISPGIQYIPGRRILFETSFQIPVLQQNITTNKTNYMVLFGTRFLIF
jgi:hypothetical protein